MITSFVRPLIQGLQDMFFHTVLLQKCKSLKLCAQLMSKIASLLLCYETQPEIQTCTLRGKYISTHREGRSVLNCSLSLFSSCMCHRLWCSGWCRNVLQLCQLKVHHWYHTLLHFALRLWRKNKSCGSYKSQ